MQPLWQWIILVVLLVLNAIPISKILGHVGLNKYPTRTALGGLFFLAASASHSAVSIAATVQ